MEIVSDPAILWDNNDTFNFPVLFVKPNLKKVYLNYLSKNGTTRKDGKGQSNR